MGLRITSWVQKSLVSGSPQFTRTASVEVEPPVQFFGDVTIRAPHTNPAGSSSRSLMTVLFEDESGAVVDRDHPRAGEIPWAWTTGVGGGRWYSYIVTDDTDQAITVPQGLRLSLVGLYGWDDSSTARTVESLTVEGSALTGAQVARYAREDGTLATVGEARVWDGQWRTVYTSTRSVTLYCTGANSPQWSYVSGDETLIESIRNNIGVYFTVPVTCDKRFHRNSTSDWVEIGTILAQGDRARFSSPVGNYTFTEAT